MIETHDLSKEFNKFVAVDAVTLSVRPGQIMALLGPNGAGKTTTIRMLTAILAPSRGSALVAGFDVLREGEKVRASVGVLTEQHGLYIRMTAIEYLDFFGQVYRLPPATRRLRSNYLLDYFGLGNAASQRIGEYSKGMRQKLALARALMHEPPVLLLDEPTSAMDPESARLVRDEILRLRSSHRTIVICTHNLAEAEALADIIAIIFKGRILLSGLLADLKHQVLGEAEYEAKFSHAWNMDRLKIPRGMVLTERGRTGLRLRVENPQETNSFLLHELDGLNAPLVAFEEVPRSLEQVYLKVMADTQELPQVI